MPNVYVLKKDFLKYLGKDFSKHLTSLFHYLNDNAIADDQFNDLCFEFGLEIEIGTAEEMNVQRVDDKGNALNVAKEVVYKLEVAANRYDLLCLEGFTQAIKSYLGMGPIPRLSIKNQRAGGLERIIVKPEVKEVRPFVVAAILRNISFDVQSYNSFIDLQDKLHQNICRRRTLGSMGTHDYDKVQGPITYEARAPKDIVFKALK
jgi:phenylalanyl-tRNA synthetase beta chain